MVTERRSGWFTSYEKIAPDCVLRHPATWNWPAIGLRCRQNNAGEGAMGIGILGLAVAVYAGIWLVIIVGSQFFGPR